MDDSEWLNFASSGSSPLMFGNETDTEPSDRLYTGSEAHEWLESGYGEYDWMDFGLSESELFDWLGIDMDVNDWLNFGSDGSNMIGSDSNDWMDFGSYSFYNTWDIQFDTSYDKSASENDGSDASHGQVDKFSNYYDEWYQHRYHAYDWFSFDDDGRYWTFSYGNDGYTLKNQVTKS